MNRSMNHPLNEKPKFGRRSLRRRFGWTALAVFLALGAPAIPAQDPSAGDATPAAAEPEPQRDGPGLLHGVLMYLPNRLLDACDMVRLRARVGPGAAVGVRATTAADVYLGSYISVFAGLPGPRREPEMVVPVGLESLSGAGISLADATVSGGIDPDYSPTEFGASLHLLLVGLDLGVDPVEALDLIAGLLTIDLRGDDL
jgi:hypothetical protein